MKTYLNQSSLALVLALVVGMGSKSLWAQGGLFIGSGAQVVASGSPFIVLENGRWSNAGSFTAGTSTVLMTGNATTANSTIVGASSTTFFNLTQQKSANNILLGQNIGVDGNLTMSGGLFQLNNFNVTLGTASGQILTETEVNRITGTTGGQILKTLTLNAPAGVNPGNMGATITSAANLGSTTIRRGHVQQTDGNTGISIFRYYDIIPTNNTGLNATLRQAYFDAELGTIVEADMAHFSSPNTSNWYNRNFTARNTATNFVDNGPYADFTTRFTLASPFNQPLPVDFLDQGIRCESEGAKLFWVVEERTGSDYFQVEASADEVTWLDVADARIPSQGIGRQRYEYAIQEAAPYFRVRQVDLSGATNHGEAQELHCNIAGEWLVWPNPNNGNFHLKAAPTNGIVAVEVVSMMGQVVLREESGNPQLAEMDLNLQGRVTAGTYCLKVYPQSGTPIIKKLDIQR